jgi:NAD(P) transhydrogenase subunit beta
MTGALVKLFYLLAAVLFILGLKRLSSPATARGGNRMASLGMLIAIVVTLLFQNILTWQMVVIGMIIGSLIGGVVARTVKMTAMPEMVALLNGFGGGASAVVASAEFAKYISLEGGVIPLNFSVAIMLSAVVGSLTFSGSLVAFGKLRELVTGRAVTYPMQKTLNAIILAGTLALIVWLVVAPDNTTFFIVLVGVALVLGILSVIPIGGADMPVVISLLNSYSGIAAAMTGFVINNEGLIISGALVGASGLILTNIMCRAMNRSLANVLFGAFGSEVQQIGPAGDAGGKTVRSLTHEDAATMLAYARQVVFAPGYGLAVAQAQHEVRELADMLQERGVAVKYAIHPVAGRMPGHMNVLLAEADVPYDQLYDMDQINPEFDRTDVSVVIGANDVVNPAARHDKASPLYGMPILDVDKSTHTIVLKRSMRPGFAGVDNELFYHEKTSMLFGDAKDSFKKLIDEVQHLQ